VTELLEINFDINLKNVLAKRKKEDSFDFSENISYNS
jgi:hypothetical protein